MNLLNSLFFIFVAEILFLFSGWMLWIAGRLVAKYSPNDAIYQFAAVFWRHMGKRPAPLKDVVPDSDELLESGKGDEALLQDMADSNAEEGEAPDGAPAKSSGVRMSTLTIKVIPHASRDQICGFLGKALKIQVMSPAEAGKANQSVIEVLSTSLGIKGHQIQLLRGHFQAQKVIQIAGLTQTELDEKLASFQ